MQRIVTIKFDGDAGDYTAMVDRMIRARRPPPPPPPREDDPHIAPVHWWPILRDKLERNEPRLFVWKETEGKNIQPIPADTIRESLATLTQKERQDLYRLLHDAFGCRM